MADCSRHLEAVADDEGRYELTGLDPGEYAILAGPPELRLSVEEERTMDLRVSRLK